MFNNSTLDAEEELRWCAEDKSPDVSALKMATGLGGVNGCPDPDIGDSRKRPLDSELDIGATKRSHHGGASQPF
ncbi:hypothetical protein V5799_020347 [Amblyomma americanum]|uniref:Uncharacterized protein n=1 Tax=Amblyomma americanum TaxID=6943 RepID=A0AAQ4EV07_AMBAM